MFKFKKILSEELCNSNPDAIVVFGDNLIGRGTAGQAIIRYCSNSYGVPTKRLPSMATGSFFSDTEEEYNTVRRHLVYLWRSHLAGKTIILPTNMLGSGLAKLQNSPRIWELMNNFYSQCKKHSKGQ